MPTEITIEVKCQGCLMRIDRPSEADELLMRNGLYCHAVESCYAKLEARLQATQMTIQSWSAGR